MPNISLAAHEASQDSKPATWFFCQRCNIGELLSFSQNITTDETISKLRALGFTFRMKVLCKNCTKRIYEIEEYND